MGKAFKQSICMLIALVSISVFAEPITCIKITNNLTQQNLIPFLYHYADPTQKLEAPWLAKNKLTYNVLKSEASHYSFGTAPDAHWLKFCVENTTADVQQLVAAFGPVLAKEFDFYPQQAGEKAYHTGHSRPFSNRDLHHPEYHFSIELPANARSEYYVRLTSSNTAFVTGTLWQENAYLVESDYEQGFAGVFAGIFIGLILYNLMLFVSIRQASSLWYIAFATSMFLILAFFNGRVRQYVLPDSPEFSYNLLLICYYSVAVLGAMYSRSYLKLHNYPKLDKGGLILLAAFSVPLAITFFTSLPLYLSISAIFSISVIVYYSFFAATYVLIKGGQEGKYFLVALAPLSLSVFEDAFYNAGILKTNFEPYTPMTGLAATMILLAFGLGRTLIEDRRKAEQESLRQSEISNQLKNNYNIELEKEIAEQTAEIVKMNESLVDLDQVKSRFFANISHEFRTPLTLIQGPLNMLIDKPEFSEKAEVTGVLHHTEELKQLIDQILSLSKFESNAAQLKASKVDMVPVLHYLTSQFSSYAEREDIELKFATELESCEVYIDVEKFQIVINNLLNNALKFTPKGGNIDVVLKASDITEDDSESKATLSEDYISLSITDSGCGIMEQDVPHIFERYYQASPQTQTNSGTGSGIGLALVKEIVNLHGGQTEVTSIENIGTRFTIALPLGSEHLHHSEIVVDEYFSDSQKISALSSPETSQTSETETAAEPETTLTNIKILIVDDNHDMRAFLKRLLSPEYQIREAVNGEDAEQQVQQELPDIILTDLMMPIKDGLELVQSLKQVPATSLIPIIMLTAKADPEDRLAGLRAEADDYLAKPFDAKELKVRIRNLLLKHQAMRGRTIGQSMTSHAAPNSFMEKLDTTVKAHLADEEFGVEALAKLMFMSSPTLRRKLAAQSSLSPSNFIRQHRLEKANQLVLAGNVKSLTDLANQVGFNQPSYFAQLYRKAFGHDPLHKDG